MNEQVLAYMKDKRAHIRSVIIIALSGPEGIPFVVVFGNNKGQNFVQINYKAMLTVILCLKRE